MRAGAFAPASVGNAAVGFDLLGFSLPIAGDRVWVEKTAAREVAIAGISGVVTTLPADVRRNTAAAGLLRVMEDYDLPFGFKVTIEKGIPLGSGMGGSAASAVAALVAANALLGESLSQEKLLAYALIGEGVASGSLHADNIAPCLLGGLTLATVHEHSESQTARAALPVVDVVSIPIPDGIHCVVVHPHLTVETKHARGILRREVSLHDHVLQSAHLAGFVAACYRGDIPLIGKTLKDILIEPQRAHLIPGFVSAKAAALESGALGCSISGAGPSVFAWVHDASGAPSKAKKVERAMVDAFTQANVRVSSWVTPLPAEGAKVIS